MKQLLLLGLMVSGLHAQPVSIASVNFDDGPRWSRLTLLKNQGSNASVAVETRARETEVAELNRMLREPAPDLTRDASENAITFTEQMPEFDGGGITWQEYMKRNAQYPKEAAANRIEGKVLVRFTVQSNGQVDEQSLSTLKKAGWGFDEEAIRLIMNMTWQPGKQNGKPVPVSIILPVTFRMDAYFFE